jgi:para-aminobenzoate synthetase component 1
MADVFDAAGLVPDGDRSGLPPLSGGAVGAWSYDLGRTIEVVPERAVGDNGALLTDLLLADVVVAVDHDDEVAHLIRRPLGDATDLPDDVTITLLAKAAVVRQIAAPAGTPIVASLARDRYLQAVREVLEHIAAGDVFQVNLTQQLVGPWASGVTALFRALRQHSPAPFAACHVTADGEGIASISPETYLHAVGRQVTTRPIKGTRPRSDDLLRDLALKRELAGSAKDRAENVMVVDMERNDLGRVCVPGSVRVPDLLSVEGHPTVWQLVSTVTGQLLPTASYVDLIRATFPCGSITGTPKIEAMKVIEELEPVRRSWYCGAVGFVAAGAMSTSVAIRTATLIEGVARYGAGGGIVADSVPEDEYEESLDKAAAFLRAVGADREELR